MVRPSGRKNNKLRDINIEVNSNPYAEGSCTISCGNTKVICTATVENKVPPFLRGTNKGWITAEYGMLPRSTQERIEREVNKGKLSGRTQEIQRLIGRSLRSIVDLTKLGEKQIRIDCDVIQADGGTRTAAITGGYVALHLALQKLHKEKILMEFPLSEDIAAISCGIYKDNCILDLDYEEDRIAQTDANFVMTASGKIIEVQLCAEEKPILYSKLSELTELAYEGIQQIITLQKKVLMPEQNLNSNIIP